MKKAAALPVAERRRLDRMSVGRSAWGLYRETRRPGAPGLVRRLLAAPLLVADVVLGRYRGLTRSRLFGFFLLTAVYVISPIDAIPDFIPVIGWGDDTLVVLWFMNGLVRESGRYVTWKRAGRPALMPAQK
ncbi:YkvA family protein [Streptacidiphilus carbonis]|jgi:uncharacterized membrane protein YkvA (DUF1232 family)|uniref:YkvA family protein n=1 Tax=Streptacidiphilus carbonis TaxID=105422 RepID=UPI000A57DF00|nr:YkvA family protein [Streptacidiphilus carbonis]